MAKLQPSLSPQPRPSLRDRRRVTLTFEDDEFENAKYRKWNQVHNINDELVLVFVDEESKQDVKDKRKRRSLARTLHLERKSHLTEIMDGLYIALADNESTLRSLRTFDNEPFTHILQMSYKSPSPQRPSPLGHWRKKEGSRSAGIQRLELICPATALAQGSGHIAVGVNELIAARDFLTLALPYGKDAWLPKAPVNTFEGRTEGQQESCYMVNEEDGDDDDAEAQVVYLAPVFPELQGLLDEQHSDFEAPGEGKVNVLIVAPSRRAIDVLSILLCYLSFLEVTTPDTLELDWADPVWDSLTRRLVSEWSSLVHLALVAASE